jgi:hypothetical protein
MAMTRGDTNATLKDLTMIAEDTIIQTRPNLVPLLCHNVPEDGAYTKIPTPAVVPFPRKFEGERKSQGKDVVAVQTYNQDTYELTIDIDSDLLRNARAYDYASLVREATISAVIFPDYLLSLAVAAGTAAGSVAYDGNPFYGDTHLFAKAGSNNIDNNLAGTGTSVTQLYTDLGTAIATFRGYLDNQGHLLNPVSALGRDNFLIQCPLSLEQSFRTLLNSEMIPAPVASGIQTVAAAPVTNSLRSAADYFPDGYLTGNSWYLHYIGMPRRPYVYIENYGLQVSVLGFGSEWETNNNAIRIALKQRFVIGYDRFDRSQKITNS